MSPCRRSTTCSKATGSDELDLIASEGRDKIVAIIGLGDIGLPSAILLANHGFRTIGIDLDKARLEAIRTGALKSSEQSLAGSLQQAFASGNFQIGERLEAADIYLIAVPTPLLTDRREADLRAVEAVASAIAPHLKRGDLVILESTSPVGTTQSLSIQLCHLRPDLSFPHQLGEVSDIRIAYCPERVLPGNAMQELVENDRIIGGLTPECSKVAKRFYAQFLQCEILLTDASTAELCKLAENAFRDVNIAYANELALICERLEINIWELIHLANRHPRVNILQPGAGVGGHCIAVDPWFFAQSAPDLAQLIPMARQVNDARPQNLLAQIEQEIARFSASNQGRKPCVALLGLGFKPNVGDLRQSPALQIAEALAQQGSAELLVVEPHLTALPASLGQARHVSLDQAIAKAEIFVVLVRHREFEPLRGMKNSGERIIIDPVGLFSLY